MNDLLQFLKDGSGIHIKKSQRGSFTKYCNGKVTNECIQRGKNSSNPKIRKKAVFAENSRKWRHQQGGVLQTFGGGGITDSLIDFVIQKEGFNETPTDIGDGKITIGSGLTAKKWIDLYNQKGVWSKEDNRAAVTEELQNRLKWAQETIPNWDKLNKNQQDALLSYKYNYDFNHINSPKLFDYLKKGNFDKAKLEINATSKNPDFKKGLEKRRKEEQKLFSEEVKQTVKTISQPKIPVVESDVTRVSNTYYPKQYRIIPTKQGSYIETDKGQILKEILDTRMKLQKMKPSIPEPYKFPIQFNKKGGKGFVKNVNVLDSNPRLYKEEKKRFPIKKAAFGQKLSNIGNKINTFMNSDWGQFAKSALTGIKDIVSANKQVSSNADWARANAEQNYANEAGDLYKQYLEENTLKAQQQAATIKALSGDTINVSPIDIAHKAWQQAYSGLGQAADQKAKDIRIIDNQEIADKTNNVMNGIMNIGQGVLGILSNKNPMKQINKFNQNYINNYQSVTAPQNYMKSIKELGNFQIK